MELVAFLRKRLTKLDTLKKGESGRLKVERLGLKAIADAVRGSNVPAARVALSFASGAAVDVSGKVRKVVRRDGQFKLVIEPGDVAGFVVFADCSGEAENLRFPKIRKGSSVRVKGKLRSFGVQAVCLSDCRTE